jgi:hypothetical protein
MDQSHFISGLRKGTRSGPYQGYASGTWLEVEMRSEVDDLAHTLNRYTSRRCQKQFDREMAEVGKFGIHSE